MKKKRFTEEQPVLLLLGQASVMVGVKRRYPANFRLVPAYQDLAGWIFPA
jgi:hypothetical protein